MKKLSCAEAKQMDMVDYLAAQGHSPKKIRGNDYWYLSPLRIEKTASFKVNRSRNIWYDHGIGKGGDFLDFGKLFLNCSIRDLLIHLSTMNSGLPVIRPQNYLLSATSTNMAGEKKADQHTIMVTDTRSISSPDLFEYLESRSIPVAIASQYCREVDFMLNGRKQTAIGFRNNEGGFELRNRQFKGSSSPKTSTFINYHSNSLVVVEGFFDFLSYQAICPEEHRQKTNFLVLNSLAFFEKQLRKMETHDRIHLFLDRDKAGINCTKLAFVCSNKYKDKSNRYSNYKDLNECVCNNKRSKYLIEQINLISIKKTN
jgi:DNA primase